MIIGIIFIIIVVIIVGSAMFSETRAQIMTEEKIRQKEVLVKNNFVPDFSFGPLQVDTKSRRWNTTSMPSVLSYNDISDCIIVEDGVKYKNENGVIRAVVGGALFGGVGAVVGAVTSTSAEYVQSVEVWITTKSGYYSSNPVKLTISQGRISKGSAQYATVKLSAEKIVKILTEPDENSVTAINQTPVDIIPTTEIDTADKLAKYKKLLDAGAISQEEYNEVKSKLLSNI